MWKVLKETEGSVISEHSKYSKHCVKISSSSRWRNTTDNTRRRAPQLNISAVSSATTLQGDQTETEIISHALSSERWFISCTFQQSEWTAVKWSEGYGWTDTQRREGVAEISFHLHWALISHSFLPLPLVHRSAFCFSRPLFSLTKHI